MHRLVACGGWATAAFVQAATVRDHMGLAVDPKKMKSWLKNGGILAGCVEMREQR